MLYSQKACWNVAIKCFYKKLWTVWWLRSEAKEMMQKVRTLENVVLLKFCQGGLLLQGLRSCDEYFRNWWQQKLRQGVCECDFDRIPYQWSSNLEWPQSYWVSILMSYIKDITVLKQRWTSTHSSISREGYTLQNLQLTWMITGNVIIRGNREWGWETDFRSLVIESKL